MSTTDTSSPTEQNNRSKEPNIWAVSIITSIIGSIFFVTIFQPLMSTIGTASVMFASSVAGSYIDTYYAQAPSAVTNMILFKYDVILTGIGISLGISLITIPIAIKLIRENAKSTKPAPKEAPSPIKKSWLKWTARLALAAYGATTIVMFSSNLFGTYISIQANATFERTFMALSPALTDDEKEIITSQWANIEGKDDYARVMLRLNQISSQRDTPIPKPFI